MNKTKLISYSLAGFVALVAIGTPVLLAQSNLSNNSNTIFQKVIDKLGLKVTSDQLQTAFKDSKNEVIKSNLETELADAVKNSKLTQDQADKAKKIFDAMGKEKSNTKPTFDENKTVKENRDAMQKFEDEQKAQLLKDTGMTQAEIDSVMSALRNADVHFMGGFGKGKGFGGRGGMMKGGMMNGEFKGGRMM